MAQPFDYRDVIADLRERRDLIDRAIEALLPLMPPEQEPAAVRTAEPMNDTALAPVLLSQRPLPPDDGHDIGSPVAIRRRAGLDRERQKGPAALDEAAIDEVVEAAKTKRGSPWRECHKCGRAEFRTKVCRHCGAKPERKSA